MYCDAINNYCMLYLIYASKVIHLNQRGVTMVRMRITQLPSPPPLT